MSREKWLASFNIFGFLLTIVLNALANGLPINGRTTGELSDLYPNLFVPAGYVFSIWGIIYLGLLLFTIWQARGLFSSGPLRSPAAASLGGWFLLSSVANASWIVAWHYEQLGLSLLLMATILFSLIQIYQITDGNARLSVIERIPFSIYLGWISIATIANVTTLLVDAEWGTWGLGEITWTMIMTSTGAILALIFLWFRSDLLYAGVVIWALVGIINRYKMLDMGDLSPLPSLLWGLVVLISVFALFRLPTWWKSWQT